jgi:hypothetical protein
MTLKLVDRLRPACIPVDTQAGPATPLREVRPGYLKKWWRRAKSSHGHRAFSRAILLPHAFTWRTHWRAALQTITKFCRFSTTTAFGTFASL